jgi:hypothetical protein
MANDVDMAKAVAAGFDAAKPFSNSATVHYAHDVETDLESITAPQVWVDGSLEHYRVARNKWASNVLVDVVAVGKQNQTGASSNEDSQDEKDDWLDFVDTELMSVVQSQRFLDRKALRIEFTERLDSEQARVNGLLYTKFQITFPLV